MQKCTALFYCLAGDTRPKRAQGTKLLRGISLTDVKRRYTHGRRKHTDHSSRTDNNRKRTAPSERRQFPGGQNSSPTPEQLSQSGTDGGNSAQNAEKKFTQEDVNKIVTDRLKAEQKRWEKKAADEKAEAERVAKMSAEEKAKHEQEKREREFAQREEQLSRKERTATARDMLAEKGIPAALVTAVDVSSDEAVAPSVEALAKAFNDAVAAEVAKKLAGNPPKKGEPAKSDPFLAGLGL